jgi:AraC family transcriptional regulator, arabinose operon regulatory protein
MPFVVHDDRQRWRQEHPHRFTLHRHLPIGDDGIPAAFPHARSLGRGSTRDPDYWSTGSVRPEDRSWIFTVSVRGVGLLSDQRGDHLIPAGSGFLARLDDPHTTFGYPPTATALWEWMWCTFDGSAAEVMAQSLVDAHGACFALDPQDSVVRWMRAMTASGSMRSVPPWEARERVWRLLVSLAEVGSRSGGRSGGPGGDAIAHAARRRILQRLTDPELTVEALAHDLGISREHLSRHYRRQTGITPREHIEEQRLDLACRLLRETGLPIVDIARQCGWRDAETFSAAFRRAHRVLPSRWRKGGGTSPGD